MKVINIQSVKKERVEDDPLFTGGIVKQTPFADQESDLSVNYIHFEEGVHNKFHTHSNDQVLIVTEGQGIVATKEEERSISEGDVVHVPAGEVHWHGAAQGEEFTHISITRSQTKLKQIEE